MTRLGMWGIGAPFRDFESFATEIKRAGMSAMELVAMDMKARGMFVSRMLSFEGCEFEKRECVLSQKQRHLYDSAVAWWEGLLTGFERCAALTKQESKLRSFWGSHQAFFKQLLNSIKTTFAIESAEAGLARGQCVVIGLLSTGEAKANEAAEREARQGRELDSEVSTPHEIARNMLDRHLPTIDAYTHMPIRAAQEIRSELLSNLDSIRMPGNALDLLTAHFGVDRVAEMTGRKNRLVLTPSGKHEWQSRAPPGTSHEQLNINEKLAFISGRKDIAIISDAASSGISLHADARFANTKRRLHITLELAWSAEKMLQQFGRTHRSNQICPPHYLLLVTDVGGEQRFASSVARRIEMLGAMTRGDRRGGHGAYADLCQYNLDTPLGHSALALMLDAVCENAERESLWDRALKMLQCHREGVPTLLGLAVVAMVQKLAVRNIEPEDWARVPAGLRPYIQKLCSWAARTGRTAPAKTRVPERAMYGTCPKVPYPELTWVQAADALARMKLLGVDFRLASDKFSMNQFLNRLLGLPVDRQNALFNFYRRVFRWVVVAARSHGKLDTGVALIQGESIEQIGEPEVVYVDAGSQAVTALIALRVDTGLSWDAAYVVLETALKNAAVKSTDQGGYTGFWKQKRSQAIVVAIELVESARQPNKRTYRILRPRLHTSSKPQYVPCIKLRERYTCVRQHDLARSIWCSQHADAEKSRLQEVWLLCGAIIPLWKPLNVALGSSKSLPVKKCVLNDITRVGVALDAAAVGALKGQLALKQGGRDQDLEAARRTMADRASSNHARRARITAQRAAAATTASAAAKTDQGEDGASTRSSSDDESSDGGGPGLSFATAEPAHTSYDDDDDGGGEEEEEDDLMLMMIGD